MAPFSATDSKREIEEHQERYWHIWDTSQPDHLYHYTSMSALEGILGSKCFWATDIRYMNDVTEQHYAWDITLDVLASRSDLISREVTHILKEEGGIPGLEQEAFRYTVSFCGQRDLARQWREYTPTENGVALALPFSVLRQRAMAAEFALIRVLYNVDCQALAIRSFMDHALDCWNVFRPDSRVDQNQFLGYVGVQLIQLMLRFKNPEYWQEHEWRVLLIANKDEHPTVLRHRCQNGRKIPYIMWPFLPENFDEVMIGPEPYGPDRARLGDVLAGSAIEGVQVSRSSLNVIS
jgi:hypothetical protein